MLVLRPDPASWTVTCTACAHPGAPEGIVGRARRAEGTGGVHLDLERAVIIPPVDLGDGEARQEWVGHADWEWRARIDVPAEAAGAARCDLVFDSIDTVAEVFLDGEPVGRAMSQFVQHRFRAPGTGGAPLSAGTHVIAVRVRAPVPFVRAEEARLGPRPVNGDWTPYPFVRKSACNFGWDWGPRVPTAGIPADVRLECWSGARIRAVRPLVVACDARHARVEVRAEVEWEGTPPEDGRFRLRCELRMPPRAPGEEPPRARRDARRPAKLVASVPVGADGHASAVIEVDRPERWWPRGFGAQPLHALHVELADAEGGPAGPAGRPQRVVRRIGLRTCELDRSPDASGTRFAFRVNGVLVPVTGANWIPPSLFPCEGRDGATVDRLLELAAAANLNMLRVWGGGTYGGSGFHDRCDELGILVWQDFMFACATYPEDPPLPGLVEREAREQVSRLCCHPSIVLWCGGNEDVLAWQSWGFRERLAPGQSWGIGYWEGILPRVAAELDPTRPYWTDSPWSGSLDRHANDPDHGDRHTWDLKLDGYRSMVPRFTSEYGHQSPPTERSLLEALGEPALRIGSPDLAARQRAWGGDAVQYAPFMEAEFHPARDFGEWLWQAHLLQARAMETAIAWLRANPERSSGSLFWQLNDVWTGHSWSVVDARLRTKPAYHAVQRAAAPRLVTVQPVGTPGPDGRPTLRVVLVNDSPSRWAARVSVRRIDGEGRTLASGLGRVAVPPRSSDRSLDVAGLVGPPADPASESIVADVAAFGDEHAEHVPPEGAVRMRAWWRFGPDRARPRREPAFDLRTERSMGAWWVHVHARTLVRDLWIEPSCDWISCAPNLVSLLPGERAAIALHARGDVGSAPALRVHAH